MSKKNVTIWYLSVGLLIGVGMVILLLVADHPIGLAILMAVLSAMGSVIWFAIIKPVRDFVPCEHPNDGQRCRDFYPGNLNASIMFFHRPAVPLAPNPFGIRPTPTRPTK